MSILVTGGAGYIGSHTAALLIEAGHEVVVIDNMSRGHAQSVHPNADLICGDIMDTTWLSEVMSEHQLDCVIHFAAESQVAVSQREPLPYYRSNVTGTASLLTAMKANGIDKIVFSSSAAVYGEPKVFPIIETTPRCPTNVYGRTKAIMEDLLTDCASAYGINFVSLRYFNAAGASMKYDIGEDHTPETHLIPSLAKKIMSGERPIIFGRDYSTPDGTCIRDYIHVDDLATAHISAMEWLQSGGDRLFVNLGSGQGYSNLQVLQAVASGLCVEAEIEWQGKRPGDPPVLVADINRAREVLGWEPEYSSLENIVQSAVCWRKRHPNGFGGEGPWKFERQ